MVTPERTFDAELPDLGYLRVFNQIIRLSRGSRLYGDHVKDTFRYDYGKTTERSAEQDYQRAAGGVADYVPDFDRMKYVELNRPFWYAIVREKTGLPVFIGILNRLCERRERG